ncbi:MAG: Asp-tRNA(Asn)/Glu-tRNA(Gln) amidotransferase subunit GatC [bacterium]
MNIKDVENLAELARIELSEEEKKELLSDMDSILGYVKQIEEVKVEDIKPEYKVYNAWREDKLEEREFSKEIITEQFPDSQDGFLKVKKIL